MAPTLEEVEKRVVEVAVQATGLDRAEVTPDSHLLDDLGLDSMAIVEFVMGLEEEFGVALPDDAVQRFFTDQPNTLRGVAGLVLQHWDSGCPERKGWHTRREPLPTVETAPFTQLGGCLRPGEWGDGPLYAPSGSNREGYPEYLRHTDGMRCVLLPAAEVRIGTADVVPASSSEQPVHSVCLSAFLVDAEPVCNAAFARFLNAVGDVAPAVVREWCGVGRLDPRGQHFPLRRTSSGWQPLAGTEQQPMMLVSWYGANAYSLWANRRDWRAYDGTGEGAPALQRHALALPPSRATALLSALPSEAQWEYAARGPVPRRYSWGDEEPEPQRMRVSRYRAGDRYDASSLPAAAVSARLGMSPFGLHHMAGNVWQWCRDWFAPDFYHRPEAGAPDANMRPTGIRSERGGSWVGPQTLARSSYRRGRPPQARGRCLGFRCIGFPADLSG